MPDTESWTIGRLLSWTTEYLRDQGAESARLDAELLLAEARGCQRIDLYTVFDEEPAEPVLTTFRELVRRRADAMPVAYLLGRREFYSLSFRVTPAVLIPRPETEFVLIELLDRVGEMPPLDRPIRIADVGTGSGILAICAAKEIANCQVTAIDVSAKAIEVARANAKDHAALKKIEFVQGDLFDSLAEKASFDFVVSNPPYVTEAEFEGLAIEVRENEPKVALVSGPTGMEVYKRLIPQAAGRLKSGGWLILEISPSLEGEVGRVLESDGRFDTVHTVKDLSRLPRVVSAQKQAAANSSA